MSRRLVPISLAALWVGCQGRLLTIHVDDTAETTVARGTLLESLIGDLGFDAFLDMDITSSEELQNQGVAPGDISEVQLDLFTLEAIDPAGADLSFLDSVDLYVEAPGLDKVRIAWADSFPEGESLVDFTLEDVDLTDYVVSESMTLTTEVTGHRPDDDTVVQAHYDLAVGVTGQGACNNL
ncbi:MAG: hypothetical protein D6798_01490 [Deltaproteobacteria bacterium]|nr:MAG: hypothetical protein D6798_01490 [Deltaproteobacteria bacterium]